MNWATCTALRFEPGLAASILGGEMLCKHLGRRDALSCAFFDLIARAQLFSEFDLLRAA